MAIRFDNIEAINLLNNQGEQTIALTNDQGIIVSGNVAMATGNATGKFAVMATGVHASYDFYNNGTSYFNGGVVVDAGLSQTGGADVTFTGNVTAPSFTGTSQGAVTGAPDATIWRVSGEYPTWGIFYDEGSPDFIQFKANGTTTATISLDNGDYTGRNATFAGNVTLNGDGKLLKFTPTSYDDVELGIDSNGFVIYNTTDSRYDLKISGTGNATFGGAVSTGGYLTLNSSDDIPRLIFNGSGDDFMFSNTANYFGLYNDTDSRWDIQVDGAGTATFGGSITTGGDINVPEYVVHDGDTNTHIRFTADRIRLVAGGTVKFDSNSPYYTETEIDAKFTSSNGTGDEWKFTLGDEGNLSGNKWYKVAHVNTGNGGLHIKGSLSNHVESFGSQKVDLLIQGREADSGREIEITGTVDVLHNATGTGTDKAGIRVIKSAVGTNYDTYTIYIRTTRFSQAKFHLTKFGTTAFYTSKPSVTSEPAPVSGGNVELDTSTLTEGHYVIVDSAAKLSVGSDITLNGFGAGYLKTNVNGVISNTATIPWATVSSTPTTISGYGITDAFDGAYSSLTGTPTLQNYLKGSNSSGTYEGTVTNWNSPTVTGFYSDDNATNRWSGQANWTSIMHVKLYDDNNNYATQIGFNTYDDGLYTRTNNAGTWTSWKEIYHSGVFTNNSSNWDTAYTDRNKWDGGSTGLTASTGRTSLGLGTAATAATGDFATAAQGTKADAALPKAGGTVTGHLTIEGDSVFFFTKSADKTLSRIVPRGVGADLDKGLFSLYAFNGTSSVEGVRLDSAGASWIDGGSLGIGTTSPTYALDVAGNAGFDEYIYHNGDSNTYIRLTADRVRIVAGGTTKFDSNSTYITSQRAISSTPTDGATTTAISSDWAFDNVKTAVPANAVFTDTVNTFDGAYSSLSSIPSTFAPSAHNHDDRYYTESEMKTFLGRGYIEKQEASNLSVGWYTVAQNSGDRAFGEFQIWDTASSRHQSVIFNAAHHFGTDDSNSITVLGNSSFSTDVFRYIRIKENGTYDGAAIQVYIDNSTNALGVAIIGGNAQTGGWALVDWLADASSPSAFTGWANATEKSKIDLDNIHGGGIATTGKIYAGGATSQNEVYHTGNLTPLTIGTTATTAMAGNTLSAQDLTDIGNLSGTNTGDQDLSSFITSQRAISSTPTDGATTTAISSDWAFDNVKTAVPANALFTDANTTYSAGNGLDLTGTTFSVETDLRDGITHVGKDASNFIEFDSSEETITFIVGGNAVAVMQSDGDLHIKGDVIAFSGIFNP